MHKTPQGSQYWETRNSHFDHLQSTIYNIDVDETFENNEPMENRQEQIDNNMTENLNQVSHPTFEVHGYEKYV